ncbi:hypothetical protein EJ02DRAFT_511635 [Clathrospora elynae]|uniref:Uncharacterized protein n=1 Tax=Clathrospora elynae TaxID=706981 RepID=A0A6A5SSE2_9PLEO|nr:hypothetical protein EJ02DRAFT_511635 [Clathrospora elynae]
MAGFIQNLLWNSVSGFVEAGTRTAGEFAGNALIKAGDAVENGGRSVGNSIEKKATGYGTKITAQTYQPSPKALPSTARKPVVKRSNSTPASSKPTTAGASGGSSTPLGVSKYPGKNQVNGATGAAKKTVGGVAGGATKAIGGVPGNLSKTSGGVVGSGQKAFGGAVGGATRSIPPFKGPNSTPAANKILPKPYPNANGLPRSNSTNVYPSDKKAPVKAGVPRPFVPPVEQKKPDAKKPYPGTNTLPGQASKTPVTQQKYKPLPRLGPQTGQGQGMQHIVV